MSNIIQNYKLNKINLGQNILFKQGLVNPLNTNTHLNMGLVKIIEILCQKGFYNFKEIQNKYFISKTLNVEIGRLGIFKIKFP